jgi:hypothetical protein
VWPFREKPSNSDILDRLGGLERAFKQLQGEWDDAYDKQRRMLSRIVKSHAKLTESDEEPAGVMSSQEPGAPATFLSQKQRLIQQQILQRRQMNGGK